jgi:hypothetical protein
MLNDGEESEDILFSTQRSNEGFLLLGIMGRGRGGNRKEVLHQHVDRLMGEKRKLNEPI